MKKWITNLYDSVVLIIVLIFLFITFSGCKATYETENYNVANTNTYYEYLESQNIKVKKGITYFEAYLSPLNYCNIVVSGDDDYTFVSLENTNYEYISEYQTTYSFYIEDSDYYILKIDADEDDFIEIDVNCY